MNKSDKITDEKRYMTGYLSVADQDKHDSWQRKDGFGGFYDDWGKRDWGGHYGVIEAGDPDKKNPKDVTEGDVQWLWVKIDGKSRQYLK